jgi:hypothetical protein
LRIKKESVGAGTTARDHPYGPCAVGAVIGEHRQGQAVAPTIENLVVERQFHKKGAANAHHGLTPDTPPMLIDNLLGDGQPQTQSTCC